MALFFCPEIFLMKFICIDFNSFLYVLDLCSNHIHPLSGLLLLKIFILILWTFSISAYLMHCLFL